MSMPDYPSMDEAELLRRIAEAVFGVRAAGKLAAGWNPLKKLGDLIECYQWAADMIIKAEGENNDHRAMVISALVANWKINIEEN